MSSLGLFHRCLLLRAMRPDRLTNALKQFVGDHMGIQYGEAKPFDVEAIKVEMNPQTPTFFVLFPGVDPTPEVELIGRQSGKVAADGTFINISMGQG
jgi:dynein heavy chain